MMIHFTFSSVMLVLVTSIRTAWITGTSPGMTLRGVAS